MNEENKININPEKSKWALIIPAVLIIIVIDQLTKILVRLFLEKKDSIPIIPDVFELTHAENTGAAFSLFAGHVQALTIISIIASIIILIYLYLEKTPLTKYQLTGWAFILGGTLGNLIDRLLFGRVTDFFNFTIINFPIFNFADIFIDIGAVIVVWTSIFPQKTHEHKE